MKINFLPTLYRDMMDTASGASPWAAAAQGVIGAVQAIAGAGQAKRNQRKLEGLISGYKPNAGIMDYYNKALARYSSNPYTSSLYKQQSQNIDRNVSAGVGRLQGRRSAVGGIASLVQGQNDAQLKAAGAAEQMQGQQLQQLGQATQMKAAEDYKPFEMQYNLLAQKASGGNKLLGAGLQNIVGGLGGIQDYQNLNSMYGNSGNEWSTGTGDGTSYMKRSRRY